MPTAVPGQSGVLRHRAAQAVMVVCTLAYVGAMIYQRQTEAASLFPDIAAGGAGGIAPTTVSPAANAPPTGAEDVTFETSDGVKLHGWFWDHPAPRAAVLYCPDGNQPLAAYAEELRQMQHLGLAVLIFDYRGRGRSGGRLQREEDLYLDARAARRWLAARVGRPSAELTLWGRWVGTGVAVQMASETGARGLALLCPFPSLPDVTYRHRCWLPLRLPMRFSLESARKIHLYHGRILLFVGRDDPLVPVHLAQEFLEAANSPRGLITVDGLTTRGGAPADYLAAIPEFLEKLPAFSDSPNHQAAGPQSDSGGAGR